MSEPASSAEVQPAATVMLVRDASGRRPSPSLPGSLEVLMLRRHPESVFAADAWVFPGGRVDEADGIIPMGASGPRVIGPSDVEACEILAVASGGLAHFVAAARECFEEAGILLARHAEGGAWLDTTAEWSAARLGRYRRGVHSGAFSLGAVLEAEGLVLDLSGVCYVSHWITPPGGARRFDTRFFVAVAPPGQIASHDAAETVESAWATPDEALARHAAAEIHLVIPTIANLEALRRFACSADLVAAARSLGPIPVAAPRFRGDATVPAGVLVPLAAHDRDPAPSRDPDPAPESPCPT